MIGKAKRFRVLEAAGFRCQYCGRAITEVTIEVDHIVPRSRGGSDVLSNLAASCGACNRGKGATPLRIQPAPVPPGLGRCGDCCPQCQTFDLLILPVAIERADFGYAMRYRCERGHEWTTCWAEGFAQLNVTSITDEQAPCWPASPRMP